MNEPSDIITSSLGPDRPRDDRTDGDVVAATPMGVGSVARAAVLLFLVLSLITGVVYPLVLTGVAQVVFPAQANGSLLHEGGAVVGSSLIGQPFHDPRYFWGRPSATSPFPYNAALGTGTNFGPTDPALVQEVKDAAAALRSADPLNKELIPADLVTSSASGLDPHISPAAAAWQIPRVARARGLSPATVRRLVQAHTSGRALGFLGEPRVNVLELNLALDTLGRR
jgi:K+-transporting ATPase ATPase C chain